MVCRALPNPENWRVVQARPRYPDGYRPRVNGYSPGQPIRSKPGTTAPPGGPYTGSTSRPDSVEKSAALTLDLANRRCHRCRATSADPADPGRADPGWSDPGRADPAGPVRAAAADSG